MNTPEGWQLVPKEPTPEMSLAAESYASHHNRVSFGAGYYRAMLSAAPQPPEQPALSICKSEVKRVATLMGWTPPIGEPAPQGGLTDSTIMAAAMSSGFAISTAHGQSTNKLMPISDSATLIKFARAIEHELLATRKRSEDEVARIMEAVDNIWDKLGQADYVGARAARAALERLVRGNRP